MQQEQYVFGATADQVIVALARLVRWGWAVVVWVDPGAAMLAFVIPELSPWS
jgi:hypothetical protein